MNRTIGITTLIAYAAAGVVVIAARPDWVGDTNVFLKNFVSQELLSLLGVILAITLASVANIHFEFNKMEERKGKRFLMKSRSNLRSNTLWLIGLFCCAVILVTVKPIATDVSDPASQGVVNVLCIGILVWHVLILISLSELAFAIQPDVES